MNFLESITSNPMFTAGAGLVGIGTGLAVLRQGVKQLDYLARRKLLCSLEIPSHDKSYFWVLQWITEQASKRSQHLSIRTSFIQHENGSMSTQFKFVPGPGKHFFKWKNTWFQIERQKEKSSMALSQNQTPVESVTLTAVTSNRSIFQQVLEESRELAFKDIDGKIVVFTSWGQEWRQFGYPRKRRPLDSVILDQGISEQIVQDVYDFLKNGKWYTDRGIPYRRGYLLYGPPGSGKSSFIQALAGALEYNICVLNLAERYLTDDRLNLLLSSVPQRSIILLEDIDSAFTAERKQKNADHNNLTFSGFLNALDGVISSEGRLIFMTTNHIEHLDPALIRPGRVDVKYLIDNVSEYQIKKMFMRFYEQDSLAQAFVDKTRGLQLSAAQLQGHFVFYKNDPKAALDNWEKLKIK